MNTVLPQPGRTPQMLGMIRALSLLPFLALAACATGPTLDQRLSTFVGRSELELVSALGVPTRHYETGGQKFLQYDEQRTVAFPAGFGGGPFYGPYGRGFYGGGFVGTTYAPVQCDVTFALNDGRVSGFSFRGQGCA
ncbi:hypothetical protein [Roseomonas populi]|uniref:Outer membrane protein assembly factor BamE n=1 Tax=Roseomonas populi TaxID=3121582 RepID=A0ABT1X767_9PROT|nr:hypothetical protein [Roseomonas pecuniae]MCR0982997.1 hypothetical protein [Roseomonas pecuniae]